MAKLTNSLHDYINILHYMSMATENKMLASCDAAFSDINCTVIKSYRDQVANALYEQRMAILEQYGLELVDDDDGDEGDEVWQEK